MLEEAEILGEEGWVGGGASRSEGGVEEYDEYAEDDADEEGEGGEEEEEDAWRGGGGCQCDGPAGGVPGRHERALGSALTCF